MMKKYPVQIRVAGLGDTLETIQSTIEMMEDKKMKQGAIIALNAVRKKYGLPLDGEQMELFKEGKK